MIKNVFIVFSLFLFGFINKASSQHNQRSEVAHSFIGALFGDPINVDKIYEMLYFSKPCNEIPIEKKKQGLLEMSQRIKNRLRDVHEITALTLMSYNEIPNPKIKFGKEARKNIYAGVLKMTPCPYTYFLKKIKFGVLSTLLKMMTGQVSLSHFEL